MLDALHACDDDEIEDRTFFVMLADFVLGFLDQTAHRLTDFAAEFRFQVLHGLFNPLDLGLGLFDV